MMRKSIVIKKGLKKFKPQVAIIINAANCVNGDYGWFSSDLQLDKEVSDKLNKFGSKKF